MLQPGNIKVGPAVYTWSLPAIKTCPGATALCRKLCYARFGHFLFQSVQEAYQENWKLAAGPDFAAYMDEELARTLATIVRVHTSGDLFNTEYAEQWHQVLRDHPRTAFYAYTRSWRDREILAVLRRMAREPNFFLWLSCDRETGAPPRLPNTRRAWMAENDDDVARHAVDLVFRDKQRTVMLQDRRGNPVCLYDTKAVRTDCAACKVCFTRGAMNGKSNPGGCCQGRPAAAAVCTTCTHPCAPGLIGALSLQGVA